MDRGLLCGAGLASGLVFGGVEKKGEGVGGFVRGGTVVEFEGDAVGALVEERDGVEQTRVYDEFHYFSVLHPYYQS